MERKGKNEPTKKNTKSKTKGNIPFCMKAPSAEHARAHDYDEPCDDGRAGDTDK